jgi:hypothetical protein
VAFSPPSSSYLEEGGIFLVRSSNVASSGIDYESAVKVSPPSEGTMGLYGSVVAVQRTLLQKAKSAASNSPIGHPNNIRTKARFILDRQSTS